MQTKRSYGIDLLRIMLMFMVCLQHVLKYGGILDSLPQTSIEYKLFYFAYVLSFCAVNGFAIISGYMSSDKPQKFNKIVDMWFQVFFYSFVLTMIFNIIGVVPNIGIKGFIKCALPVTFNKFWYFTAYVGLFFAIPILNKFIFSLSEQKARKYLILICIMFVFIGVPTDAFKTNWGYSALWLIVLYCAGAFAKIGRICENQKTINLVIFLFMSTFVAWFCSVFLNVNIFIDYISPAMFINGLLMVIIFSRLKIKGTIVSKISPLVFGVYLFHENEYIRIFICSLFANIQNTSVLYTLIYILCSIVLIFLLGLSIEFFRRKIAKAIKLPVLSKKIVILANLFLERMCAILK